MRSYIETEGGAVDVDDEDSTTCGAGCIDGEAGELPVLSFFGGGILGEVITALEG